MASRASRPAGLRIYICGNSSYSVYQGKSATAGPGTDSDIERTSGMVMTSLVVDNAEKSRSSTPEKVICDVLHAPGTEPPLRPSPAKRDIPKIGKPSVSFSRFLDQELVVWGSSLPGLGV